MSGKAKVIVLVIVVVFALAVLVVVIPLLNYVPQGNPPVHAPPAGLTDTVYHEEDVILQARSDLENLGSCITYSHFDTDGRAISLYGNYTSDRLTRFFITDSIGWSEIQETGTTNRLRLNYDDTHGEEWDLVLSPYQNGSFVSRWYVVISAFGYPYWESDRTVSYYMCQDLTAPAVDFAVPVVSEGMILLNVSISDLHCNIQRLEVYVDGVSLHQDYHVDAREHSVSIPWNTTTLANGKYNISVHVMDEVGNSFAYKWSTTVNNPMDEPSVTPPVTNIVLVVVLVSGVGAVAVALLVRSSEKQLVLVYVWVAANEYVMQSEDLRPHEIFGFVVDALSLLALTVATIRWLWKKYQEEKEKARFTSNESPGYYG